MHDELQDQPTFTLLSVAQVTHNYYFGAITAKAVMQTCKNASRLHGIQAFAMCASKKGIHLDISEMKCKSGHVVSRLYSGQTVASMAWQLGSSLMIYTLQTTCRVPLRQAQSGSTVLGSC